MQFDDEHWQRTDQSTYFRAPIMITTDIIRLGNTKKGTLSWQARTCPWIVIRSLGVGMKQKQQHQDHTKTLTVQPLEVASEPRSTATRKRVQWQHKRFSTGETADGVRSAFQTAGCWWSSACTGTRSACRNWHHDNVVLTITSERKVYQNSVRFVILGETPWYNKSKKNREPHCMHRTAQRIICIWLVKLPHPWPYLACLEFRNTYV